MKRKTIHKSLRKLAVLAGAAMFAFTPLLANNLTDEILRPAGTVEGTLSNGLKYIILPNDYPAGRAEFRLVWKVGAVQQDDSQGGCAHFLEHMAFGGSKNFPSRGAVAYLESLGMKYGIDINAFTGHDRTIYMFGIPTDSLTSTGYEKPLAIIRDWADALTINPARVETEKGIILEELRSSFQEDPFYDLKIGQNRFSSRMPLGTPDEVKRMTAKTLKDYYNKWYIPQFGAIVVVGDVDAQALEKQIKKQFSSLKSRKDPGFEHYPLTYNPSVQIMYDTDTLNMRDEAEIIIPHPTIVTRSLDDVRRKEAGNVITNAFAARLRNRGLRADISDAWYLSGTNHLVFTARSGNGLALDSMISLLASEIEGVREHGFSQDEIRYYSGISSRHISELSHDGTPSGMWCEELTDYFLSDDRYLTDSTQIATVAEAVAGLSADEANTIFKEWLNYADSTMLFAVKTAPERCPQLSLDNIMAAWKRGLSTPAEEYVFEEPVEKVYEKVDVPEVLKNGWEYNADAIKSIRRYPALGIDEYTLGNGLKIILRTTADDSGVLFAMLGPGGYSSIPPEKMPLLGGAASYIDMGGIAKGGPELSDFMYQNDMALSTALENDWHGFLGAFNPSQANLFANLVYEKITDPELRYDDFNEVRDGMLESVGQESILSRMLSRASDRQLMARMDQLMGNSIDDQLVYSGVKDKLSAQKEYISRMNLDSIAEFYKGLYSNPAGTSVVICGTFDKDSILRAFVPVFSALGEGHHIPERCYPLNLPTETYTERFANENESQTEFDYLYFGRFEPGLRNSLVLKLISNLLRSRIISELREKRALVYSPYVSLNYEGRPRGYFYFDINSSSKNSNMPEVEACIRSVIEDLRTNAPEVAELDAIKRSCIIAKRETLTPYSPSAWRTTLLSLIKNDEALEDFEHYEDIISSISPAEILENFRQLINPDLYVLLYMSDKEIQK